MAASHLSEGAKVLQTLRQVHEQAQRTVGHGGEGHAVSRKNRSGRLGHQRLDFGPAVKRRAAGIGLAFDLEQFWLDGPSLV